MAAIMRNFALNKCSDFGTFDSQQNVMAKITVQNTEVNVIKVNGEDYICLTDMLRAKDGDFFITDWLRNRNTLEYIGIWEKVYNPNFNWGEFAIIRNQSGLNSFKISVKEFVARTNAISVQAKAGRYGGTATCGVTYGNGSVAELRDAGADYLISDFSELYNTLGITV